MCKQVPRYPLFYKCVNLTCLPFLRKYKRLKFTFKLIITCPTCRHDSFMYEIYTYQVKKIIRPDSISMWLFNKAKFISFIQECGQSVLLKQINHHVIYECRHRNIQCTAQFCKFINKLETVTNHSIECPFYLIYCAKCKTLSNVFVLKHDCKVIQA